MERKPRVTVVMRTFGRPDMLAAAIADVQAQDFTGWELVIVNDAGDRDDVDRVVEASGQRGRTQSVRVIHLESHGGRWVAANVGAKAATGDFVNLHDDDDSWHPSFLARTVAWLDAHPDEHAVATAIDIIHERADGTEERREPLWPELREVTLFDLMLSNRLVPIGMLYRASTLRDLGYFDESLEVVGDWEYHLRLAQRRPIQRLAGPVLAFWHQRPASVGHAGNSMIAMFDTHRRYDKLIRDRELRDGLDQQVLGSMLYLTRFIDEQNLGLHHHLEEVEGRLRAVEDRSAEADELRGRIAELTAEVAALRTSWSFRIGQAFVSPMARLLAWREARRQVSRPDH